MTRHPVTPFAFATLIPLPLLVLGALWGGVWIAAAVLYLTLFALALDQVLAVADRAGAEGSEFPAADGLSAVLALAHLALVPLGVAAVAGATGLGMGERVAAFFGFGLFFGQMSNSNAHELIHRGQRGLFSLGQWVYISLLYGHHTTAHRLLHHRHVATPLDPNFPPKGMTFFRYFPRAWAGSFVQGFRAEQARLAARRDDGRGAKRRLNPYVIYVAGAAGFIALAYATLGWPGVAAYLGLAFYAQTQLVMSDYLQHYGLGRQQRPDGSYEAMGPQHSWNTPHWFSSAMMVNAPRHSDHHANPQRPYPALRLPADQPMLPLSLPAMGIVALVPPLWRRMMDRRVDRVLARAAAAATVAVSAAVPIAGATEGPAHNTV
ncbi:alkane 1-monooxygenase [Roseicitreum antarcticum]|uniref:Alkane 1-monooxygenase n=1 Tax=Roseicitreum antarcticum TaxID=564137 RepID=A0A1H3A0Z5_9RHOB|nr:alkane 1-monooxygenase [Roseicitreum antarcticum]SDX23253.1 alkane 1-monooxygenase [Roseicitreum antarcticum]